MLRVLGQVLQREVLLVAVIETLLGAIGVYTAFWSIAPSVYKNIPLGDQIFIVGFVIFCFGAAASILGLYRSSAITDFHNLLTKSLLVVFFGGLAAVMLYWADTPAGVTAEFVRERIGVGRSELVVAVIAVPLAWLGCLVVTQVIVTTAIRHRLFFRRILIIVSPDDLGRFETFIANGRSRQFEEIQLIKVPGQEHGDGMVAQLIQEISQGDRLWVVVPATGSSRPLPASVILALRLRGVRVLSEAAFWEHERCSIDVDGADESWVFDHGAFRHGRAARIAKRTLDLGVAIALIALTFPLMVLVSILIKLESRGPCLYRQERVGLHGRLFVIYKFRSMREDAEALGIPQWASVGDPRVTRVGRIIRYTRIDELPQLFNVLRGDMSVIGPRPERPYFVDQLVAQVPFYAQRHCVKPGITGWAQINAPYGSSLDDARDKLRYDLYYAKNRGFLLDLWILVCTVQVVLFRQGAR
jgi:exopolysaccharide biosynthesis polyprenyl glycosylphosphotransferase